MIVIDEKEFAGLRDEFHEIVNKLNRDAGAFDRTALRMAEIVRKEGVLDLSARKEYVQACGELDHGTANLMNKVMEQWDYLQHEPEEEWQKPEE